MQPTAIETCGLGKRYQRGSLQASGLLRDSLARFIRSPFSFLRPSPKETFWALEDVSLHVLQGQVIGLIGRNGSGKTTLLKILSRIVRPTKGWAEIHGRVGSLLEVGTGFHPELSGRENTYLSGAILGMSKQEISSKFDEIVGFAELEKFIDTPVKHYSSGMYVRLAFAVAAHLEPEIMLVDEVLAVGDIRFQKKCLGKMGEVAREGRTVILVSHQLNQIRRLCERVVWLEDGKISLDGPPHTVVGAYESAMTQSNRNGSPASRKTNSKGHFTGWEIVANGDQDSHTLATHGQVSIRFFVEVASSITMGHHGIALYNSEEQLIWGYATDSLRLKPGVQVFSYTFKYLPLRPGSYTWRVSLYDGEELIDAWECLPQMVVATEPLAHPRDEWAGLINLPITFGQDQR